ncbi:MAG: acetolactate synthase large subunit [Thaumarchaeota archaeon]|nr:acetolactate synthase large subunit [Nitrososphaerota archaeon]
MKKGAELFVECLETEFVEYVFGLPGEEILPLLDVLSSSKKIKFVLTRHEQSAAFMADIYGRLTGKPGVCLVTLGPGATNLVTGVADANLDRSPVVAITGQGNLEKTHKESHQYIDIVSTFKFITKWNSTVTRADYIPEIVWKAFRLAREEKKGATHIELPENVCEEDTSARPLLGEHIHSAMVADKTAVSSAAEIISKALSPIILAGNGVTRANASSELVEFARATNIPVVNTFMGKGVIPANDELSLGTIGLQARDYVMCGVERADLVISIGYDLVEYAPRFWNPNVDKKIIHIDSTHSETDTHFRTIIDLKGDIKETLKLLATVCKFRSDSSYTTKLKRYITSELEDHKDDNAYPLNPQKIVYDIRETLDEDDILISDVGMHKIWISRLYPAYRPNTVLVSNGLASMGVALPGAIAAKLVHPDKKIIAACGDGGFLMSLHELETAKRLGLALVLLVFNDSRYSQVEWKQLNKYGRSFNVEFTNPDFVKLAESFSVNGIRIEKAEDLQGILKEATKSSSISIIDVPVGTKENLFLSEKLGNTVCPV